MLEGLPRDQDIERERRIHGMVFDDGADAKREFIVEGYRLANRVPGAEKGDGSGFCEYDTCLARERPGPGLRCGSLRGLKTEEVQECGIRGDGIELYRLDP